MYKRMCDVLLSALVAGVLYTACGVPEAVAQNTQCSDRPSTDSSNACANTRFVQTNPGGGSITPESCGAKGDGVTNDAPAIRQCAAQVAAQTGGGTLQFSCTGKTYLLGSKYSEGNAWAILRPYSNVTYDLCASTLKVANNMNTAVTQFHVILPPDNSSTYTINNFKVKDGTIDFNGANNSCGGTCYYNNVGVGLYYGSNLIVDGTTFANNPGSQNISVVVNVNGVNIINTKHLDSCDIINAACTDHSSIFVYATNYTIANNTCRYSSQSTKSSCWEMWGFSGTATGNTVNNYSRMVNIAGLGVLGPSRNLVMTGNTGYNLQTALALWCDAVGSSALSDITIADNSFRQSINNASFPFFDFASSITADCAKDIFFTGNIYASDVAAGTAASTPTLQLGRAANQIIDGNLFNGGLGPAIGNGTLSAATSFELTNNRIRDAGQTSTAAGRRGVLISSAVAIASFYVANNSVLNVASTYMTDAYDISLVNAVKANIIPSNTYNTASAGAFLLPASVPLSTFSGVVIGQGLGFPQTSTAALSGAMLHTDPSSSVPALSRTPVLGVAGTARGSIAFRNLTSGTLELGPATGALGTSVVTFPIGAYNAVGDTLTQTLTNKTLGAVTLSGTVTGGGNSINNVVVAGTDISNIGLVSYKLTGVNFNSANTDNALTLTAPPGTYSRYQIFRAYISGCSGAATSATFGVFTDAAGAGTAIVASGTAVTVSTASENTANNTQNAAAAVGASGGTTSLNDTTLFWRIQTAHGSAVTCNVTLQVQWVS